MADIISLGEVLIDLTQTGTDEGGISQFAAYPGGAPANVAVAAARLGANTGFIGKVGRDSFGLELRKTLEREGVDTSGLFETDESPTTLAIVHVDESGERSFAFYRQPGADTCLTAEEAAGRIEAAADFGADPDGSGADPGADGKAPLKILHFGSLSLTDEPSRTAALAAVARAKEKGVLICYDPNFRPALWSSEEKAVLRMKEPLEQVDIIKVSDEEMVMLTGTEDLEEGTRSLAAPGITLVMVTLGSEGVFYRYKDYCGKIPGVHVKVADTNGAGDTFLGAMLMQIVRRIQEPADFMDLSEEELIGFLSFANRAAAKTCSRSGAIPAMPTIEELAEGDPA